jgi:hypothetical protein
LFYKKLQGACLTSYLGNMRRASVLPEKSKDAFGILCASANALLAVLADVWLPM